MGELLKILAISTGDAGREHQDQADERPEQQGGFMLRAHYSDLANKNPCQWAGV
jgi:hypothetical protein